MIASEPKADDHPAEDADESFEESVKPIEPPSIPRLLMLGLERARTTDHILDVVLGESGAAHSDIEATSNALPPGHVLIITVAEAVDLFDFPAQEHRSVTSFRSNHWHSEPGYYYFTYYQEQSDKFVERVTLHEDEEIVDIKLEEDPGYYSSAE